MNQPKPSTRWGRLIGAISLVLFTTLGSSPAQAGWFDWLLGRSPVSGTPTGRRTGGGDRSGSCPKSNTSLTALAPLYKAKDGQQFILGSTVSTHPTLWFYLPYEINENRPAELRIEERQNTYRLDRTIVTLTKAPAGVIGVPLPPDQVAPLKVGEPRYFTFVIRCDPKDSSANKFVGISVERVPLSPALRNQLETASPNEQVNLYGNAGIWFETLTIVAQSLQRSPADSKLRTIWTQFLKDFNLPPREPHLLGSTSN
ncbi:DUF928 domain-containing protein [Kovacikia minuta CCNUW1]|uniref:DUF928 domain-containing protein n=1 Tax=Kovacikia minuta TaxID=2931930 RepID=UPI001CCE0B25|nr:DUF928 domain-containing protein [Kovacikia minuta]UBF26662.1 DUF928 domain-containing protein [Kovacikia minuta CCNUW1]